MGGLFPGLYAISFNNYKSSINFAETIRIARQSLTKRRRHDLSISELYLPVGQKIPLGTLYRLHSYQKFKKAIINAFKNFNYLHE